MKGTKLVIAYLVAIVGANLLVNYFGPKATFWCALGLIGLDLSARDGLHDLWGSGNLRGKMFKLILAGSVITMVLNLSAWRIAVASVVAFTCAAVADTVVYHILRRYSKGIAVNASNIVSSTVDSFAFIGIAFRAPLLYSIIAKQIVAKIGGGFLWFLILRRLGFIAESTKTDGTTIP